MTNKPFAGRLKLRAVKLHAVNLRRTLQRHPWVQGTLLATLAYMVAAGGITYPLVFNLSSSLAGAGDNYEYHWTLWRVQQMISGAGGGLAHLPWLNHPAGLYHPFMLTMLTVDLTAAPLLLVLAPHTVYNLLILSGFVLCALSTYWFASELTGNARAGLIAGFVFGFFSNKMGHVLGGHLPQTVAYWAPMFALTLWHLVWKPSWWKGVLCSFVLVPTVLVHPIHVVYFVVPVTLVILFQAMSRLGKTFFAWQRWRAILLAFGLATLVVVPVLWPSVSGQRDEGYLSKGGTVRHSVDLLAWVTPSPYHPLLESTGWPPHYVEDVFPTEYDVFEGLAYPGALVGLLGILALATRWRETWIWGVLAVGCMVLSLGPILKVGGEPVVYEIDKYRTNVVLPYALIKPLPLVGVSRTPGRLGETAMFALAVLAAFAFDALPRWATRHWRSTALVVLLALGISIETLVEWPMPLRKVAIPSALQPFLTDEGKGSLLHVPLYANSEIKNSALHYQTFHERPIVGGWIHRRLPQDKPWVATFYGLLETERAGGEIVPRPSPAQRRAWLHHLDVDHIILHKAAGETLDDYRRAIEELLGPAATEDEQVAMFEVPDNVPPPAEALLYSMGGKWSDSFQEEDGDWGRWIRGSGHIYVYSTKPQRVRILFGVDSALDLAHLELKVDGALVDRFVVGEPSTYVSRSLNWQPGMHTIVFRRVDEDEAVSPEGDRWDVFALDGVRVIPEADLPREASLSVDLAGQVQLTGYELDAGALRPGDRLTVTLTWRASQPMQEDLVVFTHLLTRDGTLVAQWDGEPGGGRFPTSAWPAGSTFGHTVSMELPTELPPGDYRLLTGMYRWPSLERLPVASDVPGAEDDVIELGKVNVSP